MSNDELNILHNNLMTFDKIKNSNILPQDKKDINKFNIISFNELIAGLDDVTTKTQKAKTPIVK